MLIAVIALTLANNSNAIAATHRKKPPEDVTSFGDVWSGLTSWVDDLAPSPETPAAPPSPTPEEKAATTSTTTDTKPPANKQVAPEVKNSEPSYRVYPSAGIPAAIAPAEPINEPENKAEMTTPPSPPPAIPLPIEPPATASPLSVGDYDFFPVLPLRASSDEPPQLLPVASNRPLNADPSNATVTRAIFFIHDISRNVGEGLTLLTALAGEQEQHTLMIAPLFPLTADMPRLQSEMPADTETVAHLVTRWQFSYSGDSAWQYGGDSLAMATRNGVSSFTALDILLLYLADRKAFPNLKDVIIVGHGSGGDFVQRYAAIGQAPDLAATANINIEFLVANASSFLYFTSSRPTANSSGKAMSIAAEDTRCSGVNAYPYGLEKLSPYARRQGGSGIRLNYPKRHVTYLVGEQIKRDNGLDQDCAAQTQGRDRMTRAAYYQRYLNASFGEEIAATHRFIAVPKAGYELSAMLNSRCGLAIMFGNGLCQNYSGEKEKKN